MKRCNVTVLQTLSRVTSIDTDNYKTLTVSDSQYINGEYVPVKKEIPFVHKELVPYVTQDYMKEHESILSLLEELSSYLLKELEKTQDEISKQHIIYLINEAKAWQPYNIELKVNGFQKISDSD